MLWSLVRRRRLGDLRFRRQHPVGGYVIDLACPAHRLGIGLDGGQHGGRHDQERDRRLSEAGWRILRLWNNDVFENPEIAVHEKSSFFAR